MEVISSLKGNPGERERERERALRQFDNIEKMEEERYEVSASHWSSSARSRRKGAECMSTRKWKAHTK
jgi:hypothetical protein